MSGVKLIFEIQQGMVSRGANISWLSMYPAEDEGSSLGSSLIAAFPPRHSSHFAWISWHGAVLFPPCTSLEVWGNRVEGSVVVVELRPGCPEPALKEPSLAEQMVNEAAERERLAREEAQRKAVIDEAVRVRAQWLSAMNNLKVQVINRRRLDAEKKARTSEMIAAAAKKKAEKAEARLLQLSEAMKEAEHNNAGATASVNAKIKAMQTKAMSLQLRLEEKDEAILELQTAAVSKGKEMNALTDIAARNLTTLTTGVQVISNELSELDEAQAELVVCKEQREQLAKDLQRRQLDMNKKDENYNKLKMEFDGMKQMVQGNL